MQAGRYGEAIDQLNKYISANPQESEGYNLRAVCFEKRMQYENARLDYRRAIAIETRNPNKRAEYESSLKRLLDIWYPLLNKKIEGHLREIAIDPNIPYNYLEIGKSYKLMEIWDKAEQWYDEYLRRDDYASPDEIIRYTEVLAKTGSIVKGERILKKYTERFPEDWRLWSRYGYFTLWLGKYAIAKKAFETALGFKPFFKEAQDGLDIVNRQAYLTQEDPRAFEKEYPIDRYYRIVRRNPRDIETRFKLVDELIKANRFEEAYQQLQIIGVTKADDERYKEKLQYVLSYRQKTYREKLDEAKIILLKNEFDKDALKTVAQYYEYLQNYDSALVMLDKYFEQYPDEKDPQLRYRYARISAWSREFDKAIDIMDVLLKDEPNNLDFQLFRAQVSVWISRDIETARQYLDNVLKAKPNNIDALISMGSLKLIDRDIAAAQQYADKAKEIDPNNEDLIKLQSNIDWQEMRAEEEKIYSILNQGRQKVIDNDCIGALPYYEEYFSKAAPNSLVLKEYGDVLFCAKNYNKALEQYNQVIALGPNYDAQTQRAKLYYNMGDSLNAVREFKDLVSQDPKDFEALLYLADSYAKIPENDSARTIYNTLLDDWELDSTQVKMVKLRKSWLPVTGIAAIFEAFPYNAALAPSTSFYADNRSFRFFSSGSRLELGLTNFISFGVSFFRQFIKANAESLDEDILSQINFTGDQRFTAFKGHLFIRLSPNFSLGVGSGKSSARGVILRDDNDVFIRFEKKDTISLSAVYQNSDALLVLYSPYLLNIRNMARLYKIDGSYYQRSGLKISGYFQYIAVDDANEGNDFNLRVGRYIYSDLAIGYEYAYSNYKINTKYYYSPKNFESHSIWLDNELDRKETLRISIGGKLGFIPQSSFLALEGHVDAFYQPVRNLIFSGRVSVGSTSRDESSYRYFSSQLSLYWTLF